MTISAEIIKDSISPDNVRLTTFQLRYPRFIHAEELTHRQLSTSPDIIEVIADGLMYDRNLSRNASSSRAIPVKRLIEDVRRDMAMPIHWGRNQPGMQAREEHTAKVRLPDFCSDIPISTPDLNVSPAEAWRSACEFAIEHAKAFDEAGYHKQIVNRLLEPFSHINVVVTATEWSNFFALRRHPDAMPEIKELADQMWAAMQDSTPEKLRIGHWHLPYVMESDIALAHQLVDNPEYAADIFHDFLIPISVARCARVSYMTHDNKRPEPSQDVALYEKLVGAIPLHASPAEHQGTPDFTTSHEDPESWSKPELHGNFKGWIQFRKNLKGECQ